MKTGRDVHKILCQMSGGLKTLSIITIIFLLTGTVTGCGGRYSGIASATSEVTPSTQQANDSFAQTLNLDDPQDFEDARRGFIARPNGKIINSKGDVVLDFDAFQFLEGKSPQTVNPSLWRHALLNAQIGLFKVAEGIYQVRGFDIANMTLIEGSNGWIVVDPLSCRETAEAAIAFARKHLGNKPVSAIVFTHSHIDHFGGVFGVTSIQDVASRKIPVVAPDGFLEEATSENIMAGPAMERRSMYQFGKNLDRSAKGMVDAGIGKSIAYGTYGILQPNLIVTRAKQELVIDGVRFVFYNVPKSESPAQMTFVLPDKKAYCGAEILTQTMHNILTPRGAKVRDALRWSNYLDQALEQTADVEVCFGTHNHPVWGRARISEFITKHRDVYRYTHDQTVRLFNAGYTPREIADMIKLPQSLESYFGCRGYYGDLRHNVKAVYQFYLGFYDGNPANLNPLTPLESGKRYLDLAGGADRLIEAAQAAFDKGDYRWSIELLNHVVFAQPGNKNAIALMARTYDQMAYMSESSVWRNIYLTAASELRNGPPKRESDRSYAIDMLMQTPIESFLDAMAAALNGPAAEGKAFKVNLVISDAQESFVLWIENAVLHHRKTAPAPDANVTITMKKDVFIKLLTDSADIKDTLLSSDFKITGSRIDLIRFLTLFDKPPVSFAVVTP
ncbi:MAG TPA: alkyl sulfatase dimerization domain-containing protein [Smithella sp.]|nr:alkyl sulfatase dimerization domain-containing protein [Smithella sp.]